MLQIAFWIVGLSIIAVGGYRVITSEWPFAARIEKLLSRK